MQIKLLKIVRKRYSITYYKHVDEYHWLFKHHTYYLKYKQSGIYFLEDKKDKTNNQIFYSFDDAYNALCHNILYSYESIAIRRKIKENITKPMWYV